MSRSCRLTLIRGWMAPDETLAERLWRASMYGWPPSISHYIKCAHFGTHKILFWLRPLLQIVGFVSSVCTVAALGWCTVHAVIAAAHSSLVTSSMNWCQQSVSNLLSCCRQNLSPLQVVLWSPTWTAWLQTHWFWGALFVVNLCSSLNGVCVWWVAHAGFTLLVPDPTVQITVQLLRLCWTGWALLREVCVGCNIKLMRGIIMLVTTYSCVVLHVFDLLGAAHSVVRVLANWLACVGGLNLAWCAVDVLVHCYLQSTRSVLRQALAWFSRIATFVWTLVMKLVALCTDFAAQFTIVLASAFEVILCAGAMLIWFSTLLLVLSPFLVACGWAYDLVRRAYSVEPVRRAVLFFARTHHHHHRRRPCTRRRPRNLALANKHDYDAMQRLQGRVRKLEAMQERIKLAQVVGVLKEACAPTTPRTLWNTVSSGSKVGVVVSLVVLLLGMMSFLVGMQPLPTQQLLPAINQVY